MSEQAIPLADCIHLTIVHENFESDAFFPVFHEDSFEIKSRRAFASDAQHAYDYTFLVFEKVV
jgi:dihydrofolate reductase